MSKRKVLKMLFLLFRYNLYFKLIKLTKFNVNEFNSLRQIAWSILCIHQLKFIWRAKLRNVCYHSGQSRSYSRFFCLHRLEVKNLNQNNLIPLIYLARW